MTLSRTYTKLGDDPVSGKLTKLDQMLTIGAPIASSIGGILAGNQINNLISDKPTSASWLAAGIFLMILGLLVIPIARTKLNASKHDKGVSARFIKKIDNCLQAIRSYQASDKTANDRHNLLDQIANDATHIIGHNARVCIYWRMPQETEEDSQVAVYELISEQRGDRSPASIARAEFFDGNGDTAKEKAANKAFITAMDVNSQRVLVQDVKACSRFDVCPNDANGYQSFILVPIRGLADRRKGQTTIGVLTADFPDKNVITEEITFVASAIAEMFSATLQNAEATLFPTNPLAQLRNSKNPGIMELAKQMKGGDHATGKSV